MSYAINIRSMSRRFGRSNALDDINLAVPEGSICGLLGRNGAGKTTLMSIVAGHDRPTLGTAEVFGQKPYENASILSKISFVRDNQKYPDDYRLNHVLRIAPEFAPNWNTDIADEIVYGFQLPNTTPIKKFSRGQLSAVAILLGLASRAPLTLLDEPYLGLDVSARALFHDILLRDYSAHPRTVVLSTHLIDESEALFDRVLIIDRGKVRVDCGIDETADHAFVVTGPTEAVEQTTQGRILLQSHTVGTLKSVTVAGAVDDSSRSLADALGVVISPVTLQELVAAHGTVTSRPSPSQKGAYA